MNDGADDVVRQFHQEEVERARQQVVGLPDRRDIAWTDLPEARPDSPLFVEWNTYRSQVGKLLAEGHQGRFVLIKREAIVGLYATEEEALGQGYHLFPDQPFLVHRVQAREPLLRCVSVRQCSVALTMP